MFFKDYITVKNIIFLLLVVLVLKFLSQITATALLFFASYVIACSLIPLVDWFEKKVKNRYTATTIVLLMVLVIAFAFFLPIVFVAIKQIQGLIAVLPAKLDALQNYIFNHEFYGYKIPEMISFEQIVGNTSPVATGIVNQSINITIGAFQGIVYFLAICMIVFYLMADSSIIKKGFIMFFPGKMKEKAAEIADTISHKVGGYVIAQILSMVAVGFLTAIGLLMLKVDYSILLGLITGVIDIIPVVGPTIALILCLVMAYPLGWVGMALVFVVFLAAQWIANNFVKPVVFGKFLDLHPLVIIFALLVAAQFLGVWGVILAPAIAAIVYVLFDELYLKVINKGK